MKHPLTRILLVEDSPLDVALFKGLLKRVSHRSFSVHDVGTVAAAVEFLGHSDVDLIVLDLGLPDSSGLDSLHYIGKNETETPILILTATEDEALGVAAIQAGAQDYLAKSQLETHLLLRSIRYAIERHHAAKEAEQRIRSSEAQLRQFIAEAIGAV